MKDGLTETIGSDPGKEVCLVTRRHRNVVITCNQRKPGPAKLSLKVGDLLLSADAMLPDRQGLRGLKASEVAQEHFHPELYF